MIVRKITVGALAAVACSASALFGQLPTLFSNAPSSAEGTGGRYTNVLANTTRTGTLDDATSTIAVQGTSTASVDIDAHLNAEDLIDQDVNWDFTFRDNGTLSMTNRYQGGSFLTMTGTYTTSGTRVIYRGRSRVNGVISGRSRGSLRLLTNTIVFRDKVVTDAQVVRAKLILRKSQ